MSPAPSNRSVAGGLARLSYAAFAFEPGEAPRAILTFLYLFLVIASYLLLKAIRNALFISEFGAVKLPWVMVGIALLVGVFASVYIRVARRLPTAKLTFWTLLFFAANVLVFWWLALRQKAWLYPVIYIWAGVYGVIAPTQVWTLANELFTTREAKRLFGFVGAGGILGSIAGGALAFRLAPVVGTPNLLLLLVGFLILAALIIPVLSGQRTLHRAAAEEMPPPRNLSQSLRLIGGSNHLRLLAGLIFITAVATTTVDFQFNLVAEQAFEERDALASFFGLVYGSVSVVALAVQLLLTSRLLRYLGVGIAILLLPALLLTTTTALIFSQKLWSAVLLKGSDGALKHSLDRSVRELLYLPLPASIKLQAKSTIDTVMDRMGDGTAGLLQLLIVTALGLGLQASLLVNATTIGLWLVLALRLRRRYVEELRAALGRGAFRIPAATGEEYEADTRHVLETVLESGTPAEKLGALEWIAAHEAGVADQALLRLVREEQDPEVRRAALAALLGGGQEALPDELVAGLEDEERQTLAEVIELLVETDREGVWRRLPSLVGEVGGAARLPLVAFTVRRLGSEFEPFADRVFEALLSSESPRETRRAAARTLSLLPPGSSLHGRLEALLDDPDPAVAAAASESIAAAGRTDLLPSVVRLLGRPGARLGARRCLRRMGRLAVQALADGLSDPRLPGSARLQAPALLADLSTPEAVAALARGLESPDPDTGRRCLAALHRLRRRRPDLSMTLPTPTGRALERACASYRHYGTILVGLAVGTAPDSPAADCLRDAVAQRRDSALEEIFQLLALEHPVQDMDRALRALREGSAVEGANAVELLDNVLPRRWRASVVTLVEGKPTSVLPRSEALAALATGPDPMLGAWALHVGRLERTPGLEEAAREASESPMRPLREEAMLLLEAAARPRP